MPKDTSVIRRIHALRQMSVADLRCEWLRLYGEATNSRNKAYLFRRLAWRIQELQHGGLSRKALDRTDEIAPDTFARARTPVAVRDASSASEPHPNVTRDPRLPSPGTVLTKTYKGRELRLRVLEDGFELDGQSFNSLSEAARHVTGSKWNGRLFWGVTERKRKR